MLSLQSLRFPFLEWMEFIWNTPVSTVPLLLGFETLSHWRVPFSACEIASAILQSLLKVLIIIFSTLSFPTHSSFTLTILLCNRMLSSRFAG